MTASPEQEIAEAQEAYLTFGGWAKAMPNPPRRGERRRYEVDVECTSGAVKSSEKGERHMRGLSILRVKEIAGVVVAPRDEDENQGSLFEGEPAADDDAAEDGPWPGDAEHPDTEPAKKAAGKKADPPSNVTQFKAPGK
jgi:hypothetical protein